MNKDKILNILQWIPVIGIPIGLYVAYINKPYSMILNNRTHIPSAIWHGFTCGVALITLIKMAISYV